MVALLTPLGGCSYATSAYIEIVLENREQGVATFSALNQQIRNWYEVELKSECAEDSKHAMKYFRLLKNDSISISSVLNAENGKLAIAFYQHGRTTFDLDAENLFIELTNHMREAFGESRIIVRREKNSGKEALEDSLKSAPKKLLFCEQPSNT